ncbi:MAG: hotdog fold thioesterase [Caldimicrobium sp.]|nr:hotdog fold thioesterase [Caldimicrobium sp.]MCX7873293.1 hotdog fold thioesterase [Caldimicrobium sp.]MDW8093469.1 hotdog fold thioesterase [Caldimicrobium sp.]
MKISLTERVKEYIFQRDRLFNFLSAEINAYGEGYAEVSMEVKEYHLNAAGVCHGGVLFTLADLAFALASNSYGTLALGIKASITYLKSAKLGDKLIARAEEYSKGKTLATYHIHIFKEDTKEKVAFFEGTVYCFDKPVLTD